MLKFTLVMGLPTDGKHNWAREYASNNEAIYLAADGTLVSHLDEIVDLLRENKSVVCDAVGFNLEDRMSLIDEILNATDDLIVEFDCIFVPCLLAYSMLNFETMLDLVRGFQAPYLHEGWDNLVYEEGYSMEEIKEYESWLLHQSLETTLDNGKTLRQHLDAAVQYVLGHSCYVADLRIAKWHDIGKIFSTAEDHANISSYLWLHTSKAVQGWLAGKVPLKETLFVATAIMLHREVYHHEDDKEWQDAIHNLGYDENVYAAALALYNANKKINK
jgi:hypothetical protein